MLQNVKGVFNITDKDDKTKDTYKQDVLDNNEQLLDPPIDLGQNLELSKKKKKKMEYSNYLGESMELFQRIGKLVVHRT